MTWTAFATVTITFAVMATALAIFTVIRRKSPKELQGALREAEAEFEAETKRSGVNAAPGRLRRAMAALRAAEEEAAAAAARRRATRREPGADAS